MRPAAPDPARTGPSSQTAPPKTCPRCCAPAGSSRCTRPAACPSRPSAGSTWRSASASSWRSWGRPARASPRCCTCSAGLSRPPAARSGSGGSGSTGCPPPPGRCLRRRHVGFVFQFFNLLSTMTVADNVELPALLAGATPKQARKRREELLAELGITAKADAAPSRLSGGEQQRVALARALANEPSLLLADEPTGNLDSANTSDVLRLLRRAHVAGQTILMVTHDAKVAGLADRVISLFDGMIADDAKVVPAPRYHDNRAGSRPCRTSSSSEAERHAGHVALDSRRPACPPQSVGGDDCGHRRRGGRAGARGHAARGSAQSLAGAVRPDQGRGRPRLPGRRDPDGAAARDPRRHGGRRPL